MKTKHQIMQEEAKKEIEKLGNIVIELHPAGGFDKENGFVYEPLGNLKYIFKFKNYKGIAEAKRMAIIKCPNCESILKIFQKTEKCSCGRKINVIDEDFKWRLDTEFKNLDLIFKGKPLEKVIFNVPSDSAVNYWLNNFLVDENNKEIDEKYVFNLLKSYFKAFFDLPLERSYDLLVLSVFQSWLVEIMDVLFYLSISGETGSGKTALLEAIMDVCRHGLLAANIKSAGIARCAERFKLSLAIDEIDSKKFKDDDVEGVCRQGYRRGQYYIRMMPKSHEPEFFNVFGFKAFSYRSGVSDDLQNRSIDVPINRTKNKEIPVINLFKQHFSPFELVFFWYLDNIANLYAQSPNFQKDMDKFEAKEDKKMTKQEKEWFNMYMEEKNKENINNLNNLNNINNINININILNKIGINIDRNTIARKTPYLVKFIKIIKEHSIFGRNLEIAYLIYSLTQILSLDITEILVETIEQKQEIEEANQEEGWIGLLKELLVQEFENAVIKDDVKVIPYKNVISKYIRRMKEVYENVPSQHQIRKLLRQIGFVDGINRKVLWLGDKAKLCLIYDAQIKENLGLKEEQTKIDKI